SSPERKLPMSVIHAPSMAHCITCSSPSSLTVNERRSPFATNKRYWHLSPAFNTYCRLRYFRGIKNRSNVAASSSVRFTFCRMVLIRCSCMGLGTQDTKKGNLLVRSRRKDHRPPPYSPMYNETLPCDFVGWSRTRPV